MEKSCHCSLHVLLLSPTVLANIFRLKTSWFYNLYNKRNKKYCLHHENKQITLGEKKKRTFIKYCEFLPVGSVPFWGVATRRKICCLHECLWFRSGLSPATQAALDVERAATSLKEQTHKCGYRWKHKLSLCKTG